MSRTLATTFLDELPYILEVQGRDGLACRVWENPTSAGLAKAINHAQPSELAGLRGILTENNLYVWQSTNVLHLHYENQTGIHGVRIRFHKEEIQAHHEAVAFPEYFQWVYRDNAPPEIDVRRAVLATWLAGNNRLRVIYPNSFLVSWYS
jgi:hypothetical protein